MADLKKILADEVRRLARKEIKAELKPLNDKISNLKAIIKSLSDEVKKTKAVAPSSAVKKLKTLENASEKEVRLSPKSIKAIRKKFGLTQKDFATLLGASHLSVNRWELGKSKPREALKVRILNLRGMGKREFREYCEKAGMGFSLPSKGNKN